MPTHHQSFTTVSTPGRIAVLGLGRMGSAIATRLRERGWDVVGWTRTGREPFGATAGHIETARNAKDAVATAGVVLLALFDGPACQQVLDDVQESLRPGAVLVNTSTISPGEAAALARQFGRSYVHAPVLGSVPAVTAGSLTIMTGLDPDSEPAVLELVRPILEALGTVRPAGDAATAAALKLVANSSLAGAILALRDALQQADALGLPHAEVLDVLALGQLGGFVTRKRAFLDRGPHGRREHRATRIAPVRPPTVTEARAAEFTVGALAKDMAVLARATDSPLRSAAELANSPAGPDADIAFAATVPAVGDDVLEPLRAYIRGHATGDPANFRDAFLPSAHIEGLREGTFVSWSLDDYCALFTGRPAADEPSRSRHIDTVDVHGSVATAAMTLWHATDTFTDIFLLARVDGRWRITNKAYHRHA